MADISHLPVGGLVLIPGRYGPSESYVATIERLTPSQAVLKNGTRVRRSDGLLQGAQGPMGARMWARPATEADLRAYRIRKAQHALRALTVNLQNLEAVEALLRAEGA